MLVCEGSRVMERAKGCAFEWGEDLKILLEEGVLAGQFASLTVELEDLTRRLLDGDAGSRRLTDVRLVPSVPAGGAFAPPDHALLLKTGGNTCVSAGFRL